MDQHFDNNTSKQYLFVSNNKQFVASKKGAYSTSKFKSGELPKNIAEKLKVAQFHTYKNTQSKDQQIELYCKTNDFSKLEEPFVSHTEWAFIPIKILKYNTPFDLNKDPVFVPVVPYDMFGSSWKIYNEYNNYNEDFISTSSVSNELMMDTQWLTKQKEYIYNLPKSDIFTLKGYTHYGDILVNSLLRDVLDYDLIRHNNKEFFDSMFYFPVFFQLDNFISNLIKSKNKNAIAF